MKPGELERVFAVFKTLIENDATHRRGFKLSECTPIIPAAHAVSEAAEALDAIAFREPRERVIEELADVVNCIAHASIMLCITPQEIGEAATKKLTERFSLRAD